jgi:hypothetical protein
MRRTSGLQTLIVAGMAVFTATCGPAATTPVNAATATRTLLTDSPFPYDRVARVDLYVVSVSASLSADTTATAGGDFMILATPNRRINVLALQAGLTDELGAVNVPAGAIKAVRLVIDTDSSSITLVNGSVLTGSSTPGIHWQSSAGRPVLNADIQDQIVVPDSGAVVVIDYDVGKAFINPQDVDPTSTDQGFIFSPVLRAMDKKRSASITGTVRAHTSTGTAVANASLRLYVGNPNSPENNWGVIATAKSDASGVFRFAYVPRLSLFTQPGWSYMVAADPPSGSSLGRQIVTNVSAFAGQETAIGIVILP